MMARLYTFLFILSVCFFTACKPDPAVVPANLQIPALKGKWFLKNIVVNSDITQNGSSTNISSVTYSNFTDSDFFEFTGTNNEAIYSSTLIGKSYVGYYSAQAEASPQLLSFKSTNFNIKFYIKSVSDNELVLYQKSSVTDNGTITVVTNSYTYTH